MVVGHQKQLKFLKRSAEEKKIAHAYLFCGPNKIGKKAAAFDWISSIFNIEINENRVHPDFVFVKADEEAKNIKIEQIRDLIWKLSLRVSSAPLKAAVIDEAHLMNADSQNCLLKTLEEPSGNTVMILIADNPRRMLPTVVSRCETVKFSFVPQKEISDYLVKKFSIATDSSLAEITRLANGRPGRAIDFCSRPEKLEKWQAKTKELEAAVASDLSGRFKYVKKIAEDENLEEILEIWQFYFRNLMIAVLNGESPAAMPQKIAAPKQFEFTGAKITRPPLSKIKKILEEIARVNYFLLTTNVNARLVLETMMMEI